MSLSNVIPIIRQLSTAEKQELVQLLLAEVPTPQHIAPLQPFKTYHTYTPYHAVGAGRILMQAMQVAKHSNI
ncbi:MAG: hypothetical protein F6J87_01880 [Spirulina sp. SIO3F2]|nr:hypothetical protein [Spirulina sp. SIO3F2]